MTPASGHQTISRTRLNEDWYHALHETKAEILGAIHALSVRVDEQGERLGEAEDNVNYFKAREDGIRLTLKGLLVAVGFTLTVLSIAKMIGLI